MRTAIEYGILNTLLSLNSCLDSELDSFLDYKLDYKLFKANKTTMQVSKAIHNHLKADLPYDMILIENYVSKRTQMDLNQWLELNARLPMTFKTMEGYVKVLKDIEDDERIKRMMKGI